MKEEKIKNGVHKKSSTAIDAEIDSTQTAADMKRNPDAPHRPLHSLDSEKQTFGCRHTNPDICANNGIQGKCAFAQKDNICFVPPSSWPKHFAKLKGKAK